MEKNKLHIHIKIHVSIGILSIILLGLYFIEPSSPWCIISCSIGASLLGAVFLSISLEYSNEKRRQKNIIRERLFYLNPIKVIVKHVILKLYQDLNIEICPDNNEVEKVIFDEKCDFEKAGNNFINQVKVLEDNIKNVTTIGSLLELNEIFSHDEIETFKLSLVFLLHVCNGESILIRNVLNCLKKINDIELYDFEIDKIQDNYYIKEKTHEI